MNVAMNTRVLWVDVREGLLGIVREPTALFFSIVMPVGFFAILVNLWGNESAGSVPAGTSMLATFGTFGLLSVLMFNPGVQVADDRERGWLRAKRVSATPLPVSLAAACIAAVPYAIGVLTAMSLTSLVVGTFDMSMFTWLRMVTVMVVGGLPFALFGLGVGLLASPNASAAILNAVMIPSVIASGLMFPLEMLPDVFADIAPMLPPYHVSQLGLAQIEGGPVLVHVVMLALFAAVAAVFAGFAYRRTRP